METLSRFGHKSLPTYYKGIKFRSRLEARWAIILDEMHIPWEYEPESIVIEPYNAESFSYLPDFYLTTANAFLEVKGSLEAKDIPKMLQIAHQITGGFGRPFEHENARPFLIAGNLGDSNKSAIPISIYNWKGLLYMDSDYETVRHNMFYCQSRGTYGCKNCYQHSLKIGNDYCWTDEEDITHKDLAYKLCNNFGYSYDPFSEPGLDVLPFSWTYEIRQGKVARFENGVYHAD